MTHLTARRLAGALCAVAAAAGALSAADPAPAAKADAPAKPWYSRVLSPGEPAKAAAPTFAETSPKPPVAVAPLEPGVLQEALVAEQAAWGRRMDVCARLRQVAFDANDDKLERQADALAQQVTALYQQRVARLGVKAGAPVEEVPAGAARLDAPPARVAAAAPAATPVASPAATPFKVVKP